MQKKKKHFTVDDPINMQGISKCDFIGRSKLYKIIKAMRYKFKNINNRQVLIEQR
jgi:hypothetical protein